MSDPNSGEVSTSEENGEVHVQNGQDGADISPSTPIISRELARQMRAVTDSLSRQLDFLCNLINYLRQSSVMRNGETSGLTQCSSGTPNTRSDTSIFQFVIFQNKYVIATGFSLRSSREK